MWNNFKPKIIGKCIIQINSQIKFMKEKKIYELISVVFWNINIEYIISKILRKLLIYYFWFVRIKKSFKTTIPILFDNYYQMKFKIIVLHFITNISNDIVSNKFLTKREVPRKYFM